MATPEQKNSEKIVAKKPRPQGPKKLTTKPSSGPPRPPLPGDPPKD